MNSIKRLIVDNFQSHKHTEVEFGPGLNVIVGPSDFGKSALVRALRWVLYNEPRGANFIRVGSKVCQVKVEMDDGSVVTRLRSTTGKNQYLLKRPGEDELIFEGFGNDVPVEVIQTTGIRKIVIDERSKVELNLGAQLEGPFLLAENGAIRAKVIGQLGGVHILDWAQRSVNTELHRLGEQEKRCQDELQQLSEALKSYEHLPQLQEKIEQIGILVHQIEDAAGKIEELTAIKSEWEENKRALAGVEQVLASMDQLNQAEMGCRQLEKCSEEYRNLVSLYMEICQVNRQLKQADQVIKDTAQVPVVGEYLQRVDPLFREWRELSLIAGDLKNITHYLNKILCITERTKELGKVEKKVADIEEIRRRWDVYRELWLEWQEHEKAYRGSCLAAERYQKEINGHLKEFQELLLRIGKCPVCFGDLDQEAVERVLDEYK